MRKIANCLLLLVSSACFAQVNAQTTKVKVTENKVKVKDKGPAAAAPAASLYKAEMTDNWVPGNPQYQQMVLMAWKGYEANQWQGADAMFAENITATMADGTVVNGRDNFLNAIKAYRGSFSSVNMSLEAVTSLKSADGKFDVVCIWGTETDNKADGSTQKEDLHEVWMFNKEGKVMFFKQYVGQTPKS